MWAVLCGTLGVAYAVSRSLSAPSGQQVLVGAISLRLPDGFAIDRNPQADLQAHDAKMRRILLVLLLPSGRPDLGLDDERSPIDFRGINQTGSLTLQKRVLSTPQGDAAQLTFTASAVLPTLDQQIVLELQVNEDADDDAQSELMADQVILRKIANSVTLTGGPPTRRMRDHSNDSVVLLGSIPSRGAKL